MSYHFWFTKALIWLDVHFFCQVYVFLSHFQQLQHTLILLFFLFLGGLTLYMYCHGWGPSTCIIFFLKLHFFLNMFIHRVIQLISISHLQYLAICFILITFFFRKLLWDHSWLNLKKKKAKIETEILQVGYIFVVKCSWFLMKKKTQALLFVLKFVIDFN